MSEISVLGAGSWGTVLSDLLAKNNNEVKIWTRNKLIYEEILNSKTNVKFLPNIKLSNIILPSLYLSLIHI